MTLQFPHPAEKTEQRTLSPLFPSVLAALILIATVASASPATAECQTTDFLDSGTIQGMTVWKDTTLNIPPLTITVQRDVYGELLSSPMPMVALPMKNNRFTRGNMENRGMDSVDTCWSQYIRTSAPVHQAMIKSLVKSPVKAFTQVMRLPASSYNGKRHILKARLTLPEVVISPLDTTATLIGPVPEDQKSALSAGLNQADAKQPAMGESLSLFEGRPIVALDPYQNGLRGPLNEALRMDLTTTRALHSGNCPNGCP